MGRRILAVLLGLAAASVLFTAFEHVSSLIHPPPPGMDFNDPVALKAYIAGLPLRAFLMVLAGHILGSFAGGVVATRVAPTAGARPALIAGGLLTLGGVINLVMIPHPIWFSIADVPSFLVMSFLGARVAAPKRD